MSQAPRSFGEKRYDRPAEDVFAVQADVAGQIVQALRTQFPDVSIKTPARTGRPPGPRGLSPVPEGLARGDPRNPGRVPARLALLPPGARSRSDLRPWLRGPGDDVHARGQLRIPAGARRVLASEGCRAQSARIRPESAGAHAAAALVAFYYEWDWPADQRSFVEALRLNESYADAHQYSSLFLASELRHDEAMVQARRALELNPLSPAAGANVAMVLTMAGRSTRPSKTSRSSGYLHPDFLPGHVMLASTLLYVGRTTRRSRSSRSGAGRARTSDGPTRWPVGMTRRAQFWRSSSLPIIAGRSI